MVVSGAVHQLPQRARQAAVLLAVVEQHPAAVAVQQARPGVREGHVQLTDQALREAAAWAPAHGRQPADAADKGRLCGGVAADEIQQRAAEDEARAEVCSVRQRLQPPLLLALRAGLLLPGPSRLAVLRRVQAEGGQLGRG